MAYGGSGTKEISKRYPVTSGIEATHKHEGRQTCLIPRGHLGVKSTVSKKDTVGL